MAGTPPRPRVVTRDPRLVDDAHPRELQPGSVVLGRYVIHRVLGRGGMATVYLAQHQQTERMVALKLLDPEIASDPSYVERFKREARAAGRIRSDFVVAIYDLDAEAAGAPVLVMEYLEGQTVQQAMRHGAMPIERVLTFGRHVLDGLAAAHAAGVIHRDLKPANLFIEQSSLGAERCKILDFGISKLADTSQQELTRDGQTLGTVAYMAPEQIRGKSSSTDPRIDLYAAGVTLFIMFTGRRPIDAEDTVQLLAAVLENPPRTLSEASGVAFPAALERFFAKALQKDPNARFQTALEMRDALEDVKHRLHDEAYDDSMDEAEPTHVAPSPFEASMPSGVRPRSESGASYATPLPMMAPSGHTPPMPLVVPSAYAQPVPYAPQTAPVAMGGFAGAQTRAVLALAALATAALVTAAVVLTLSDRSARSHGIASVPHPSAAPLPIVPPPLARPSAPAALPPQPVASPPAPQAERVLPIAPSTRASDAPGHGSHHGRARGSIVEAPPF